MSGLVLPIGGIREKSLAARRHGIKTVILPQGNDAGSRRAAGGGAQRHDVRAGRHARGRAQGRDSRRHRRHRDRDADGHVRPAAAAAAADRSSAAAVAFYISGHGFGHASRQIEIINALARRRPDVGIFLRTSAARWLLERTLTVPFELDARPCDTGIVQLDSLHLDAAATIAQARAFYATLDARAAEEAALLRAHGVRFVVADAPPLGCAAAATRRHSVGGRLELHLGLDLRRVRASTSPARRN